MSRGHAKSSWATTIFPLFARLCRDEPFTVVVSETDNQAVKLFRDMKQAVENILGDYDLLHRDFGQQLSISRNTDHELEFADGSTIQCLAAGASSRGLKHAGDRPGLIVIDDLEEEKAAASPAQRESTWQWFTRTVKPMPHPERGRIVWVGTLLHPDASMPRAERSGAFKVIKKQAIIRDADRQDLWEQWENTWEEATLAGKVGKDVARAFYEKHKAAMDEGAEVLWPSRFPYITLREIKREIGSFAFSTEYQNEAIASENQIIKPTDIIDFSGAVYATGATPETVLRDATGATVTLGEMTLVMAVDPAISKKSTADFFVALVLAAHPNGTRWVLDMVRSHLSVDEQVREIITLYQKWRRVVGDRFTAIGIETVAYQEALKQLLDQAGRKMGLALPTKGVKPIADKILRLQRWQPQFEQHLIRIQTHAHSALVEELTGFTRDGKSLPTHDDTVDALTYALELSHLSTTSEAVYTGFYV